MKLSIVLALLFIAMHFVAAEVAPSSSPTATPSATPACLAPEFRQFDFWLGKWKVTNPKGVQVGTSEISRVSQGCAVREQWTASDGTGGTSLNYYDESDHEWHQDWVGGDGTILHLHGGLEKGVMLLANVMKTSKGTYRNRITYTPLTGGKVKQQWDISTDEGVTWQTTFVGTYEKQS